MDLIYTSHFLEHIPDDTVSRVLQEARRCLRPGGYLVVKIPDFDGFVEAYLSDDAVAFQDIGTDSVSATWERHGIIDSIDSRFAMMFCGYMNEAYGSHFTSTPKAEGSSAFHGPPRIDKKELLAMVLDNRDSPHQLAKALRALATAEGEVFRWNHQNAWSRHELTSLLEAHHLTVQDLTAELSQSLAAQIPDFESMRDWSLVVVARRAPDTSR